MHATRAWKARRVYSPGSARRTPGWCCRASSTACTTAGPPCVCSSTTSSPAPRRLGPQTMQDYLRVSASARLHMTAGPADGATRKCGSRAVSPVKLAGPGNLRTRPRSSISPVWGRLMLAKACTQSNFCYTMLQQLNCKLGSLRIAKQYLRCLLCSSMWQTGGHAPHKKARM